MAIGMTVEMAGMMRENQTWKMADIARLAGVSKSTVSRALSDSSLVNDATKARIREIASAHNYKIDEGARNFRLRRSHTIAVVLLLDPSVKQHVSDPFFLDLLGAIADALTDKGYELLLSRIAPRDEGQLIDLFKSGRSDGVILIGQSTMHTRINALADEYKQFAVWGGLLPDQRYCSVGSDNAEGAYKAVRHLIRLGRTKIVFLGDKKLPEVRLRYEGYRRALDEAGLSVRPELEIETLFVAESAYQAIQRLWKDKVEFDGIFAASDVIAMSAIKALNEHDLHVPKDVSVVGYDDITMAAYYNPALTTVRQNISAGGRMLVDNVLKAAAGEKVESSVLPTELVVRKSCGG